MSDPLNLSPVEFEIFVRRYLEEQGNALIDFRTQHLEKLEGSDGDYIIDVTARFRALGVDFLVVVECKRYKSKPIERELVQILDQKCKSIGAHKAILFTTSTFRQGAIDYAAAHGIALVQVTADDVNYAIKSSSLGVMPIVVVPISLPISDHHVIDNISEEELTRSEIEQFDMDIWIMRQLSLGLDYLEIVKDKGYVVDPAEIEACRVDIEQMEAKLVEMLHLYATAKAKK